LPLDWKSYVEARGSSRRFAAAFLILHRPELHPYISAGIGRETPPGHIRNFHAKLVVLLRSACKRPQPLATTIPRTRRIDGPLRAIYSDKKKLAYPNFLSAAEKTIRRNGMGHSL